MSEEPLTDVELAELESLAKAASPAPWIAEYGPAIGGPDFIMITDWDSAQPDMYVMHDERPAPVSDLRFIAAARNCVPRLLAEVRRCRRGPDPAAH
jgi:hypothetical protein